MDDSGSSNPSRVGSASNPFLDSEQLDTIIVGGANSYTLSKTQMKSSFRTPDRSLINSFNLIQAFCDRNRFSKSIVDRAKFVFKTVEQKKILRGKNSEGIVAACIYIACRAEGFPRTFKEISILANIPKKEVGKAYKLIYPHIDRVRGVSIKDIVSRFCSDLNVNIRHQNYAIEIAQNMESSDSLSGKSPDSVAAAIIYTICVLFPENKKIEANIPAITKVTETTLKHNFLDIKKNLPKIIPKDRKSVV